MKVVQDLRELFSYRELIAVLAQREIRSRYKYTLLGAGWALALPVGLMLIFTMVFSQVAPLDTGDVPYPIFAYIGLLPWQLHAAILTGSARSLTDNRSLVTKVYFAREALPLARVAAALFDFAIAATVLGALMAWYGIAPGPGAWLVPVVLLVQIAFGVGLAFIIAAANLLYRDVQYVLQVVIMVWMFGSAVVYPLPQEGWLLTLSWINPITPILNTYRGLLVGNQVTLEPQFLTAAGISLFLLIVGWLMFRKLEGRFGELA
ncbi:MAG: ABC transporter permease [Planctomycetes bacterium]|nr:ABC transporter permease [Planctomycetota bacterium]MCA8935474.1 ABC transporter permease [Planctomycetota bacterium]MCA8944866.1 ABC transporter permease [Planctomycetota bacterium]